MKRVLLAFLLIVLFHLSLLAGPVEKLNSLRCEYLTTPLGIDVLSPRLSWKLPVGIDVQKAYQLIVGTDSASVARGVGNRWILVRFWHQMYWLLIQGKQFNLTHDIIGKYASGIMIMYIRVT